MLLLAGCGSDDSSNSKLPEVKGAFAQSPNVKLPKGAPAKDLESKVLIQGTGPAVTKGQYLVAHYLGETYRDGKVFDQSYQTKAPRIFQIGAGAVIPGWDKKLVGVKAGSRVVLSIPPADGYGSGGQAQ